MSHLVPRGVLPVDKAPADPKVTMAGTGEVLHSKLPLHASSADPNCNPSSSIMTTIQTPASPPYFAPLAVSLPPYFPRPRMSQEMLSCLQAVIIETATSSPLQTHSVGGSRSNNNTMVQHRNGNDNNNTNTSRIHDHSAQVDRGELDALAKEISVLRQQLREVRECDRQRLATLKSRHQTAAYRLDRMREEVSRRPHRLLQQ